MHVKQNHSETIREQLKKSLGIPVRSCDLSPECRGLIHHDQLVIEKWIFTSEPGSLVTSLLYRPEQIDRPIPAIVITNGHGGSKTSNYTKYVGQLYAKFGIACLVHDTIGEEERHITGAMGTRAHDDHQADHRAMEAGRTMMGKMLYDTICAVDFLCTRSDIDHFKLGVAGNSLGGAIAGLMAGLEPRLSMSIVSGFGFGKRLNEMQNKLCTLTASRKLLEICTFTEFFTNCASHCNLLVMNGQDDAIITKGQSGVWDETCEIVEECRHIFKEKDVPGSMSIWFQPGGGHRGYHLHKDALLWIHRHLGTLGWDEYMIRSLSQLTLGEWYNKYGLDYPERYRKLYWNALHHQGTELPDLGIKPIPSEQLTCLNGDEIGQAEYTLEGWLQTIETSR